MDIAEATLAFFRTRTGPGYAVESGGTRVPLDLVAADPLTSGPSGIDPQRSFSLVFEGPAEPRLAQGTYTIHHPDLEPAPIFLVPVFGDADGMRYEAVFNRLA